MSSKTPRLKKSYSIPVVVSANKDMFGKIRNYEASLGDVVRCGDTPDEAVAALAAHLLHASQASYSPLVIQWRRQIYVAHFDGRHNEWLLRHLPAAPDPEALTQDWLSGGSSLFSEALGRLSGGTRERDVAPLALRVVSAALWCPTDGYRVPYLPESAVQRREMAERIEFCLRYADAQARGLSDDDAHSYAGRNPARQELWAHEPREPLPALSRL